MSTFQIWLKASRRSIISWTLSTQEAYHHLSWNHSRALMLMCSFWHKTLTRFFSHRTPTSRAKSSSALSPTSMTSRKILESRLRSTLLIEAGSPRMTSHPSASGSRRSSRIKSVRYRSLNDWRTHPLSSLDRCRALCELWCKWWRPKGKETPMYHNRCNRQQRSKSLKSMLHIQSLSTSTISERQIRLPRSSSQNNSLIMSWCNRVFLSICNMERLGSSSLSRAT